MRPQGVNRDRVLGIVFPPFVVWDVAQRLKTVVVARGITALDDLTRDASRITGAEIRGLQVGAQHTLGGNRISPHEFAVAGQHAAEILRPRAIKSGIEDRTADMSGAQFLRLRREAPENNHPPT